MSASFTSYALLGSGRLAHHLRFYLRELNLPVRFWSRDGLSEFNSSDAADADSRLRSVMDTSSHVLFAVRDDALSELTARWQGRDKTLVHFSGALRLPGVTGAHPLMTFGPQLGNLEWYRHIPFVIDRGHRFEEILPGLPNPSWQIATEQRPLYHALCSLAGNSTFLLWRNIGSEMERALGLPRELLAPLLHQVVENASNGGAQSFTGPVARRDWQTVGEHLRALRNADVELLNAYRGYLRLAEGSGHPIPEEML